MPVPEINGAKFRTVDLRALVECPICYAIVAYRKATDHAQFHRNLADVIIRAAEIAAL